MFTTKDTKITNRTLKYPKILVSFVNFVGEAVFSH